MDLISFLSGIFGATFGAVVSGCVAWHIMKEQAKLGYISTTLTEKNKLLVKYEAKFSDPNQQNNWQAHAQYFGANLRGYLLYFDNLYLEENDIERYFPAIAMQNCANVLAKIYFC